MKNSIFTISKFGMNLTFCLIFACESPQKKSKNESDDFENSGPSESNSKDSAAEAEEKQLRLSERYGSLMTTLKPTPLVPYNVNGSSLDSLKSSLIDALRSGGKGNKNNTAVYANLLSVMRIGRDSSKDMLNVAEQYVSDLMKRKPDAALPDTMKLDLAIAALARGEYSFADFYLSELVESKSKDVKAAAYVAQGLVYYNDDMVPEAVQAWKKSLEIEPKNLAAHLNLGLTALNFGDFSAAQTHLNMFTDDWFGQFLMITIERFSGKGGQAYSSCNRILLKQSKYKPLYYNCALVAYQSENQADQAIQWLEEYDRIPPSPAAFDQKARELRMAISESKQKQRQAPSAAAKGNEEPAKDAPKAKEQGSESKSGGANATGTNEEGFD